MLPNLLRSTAVLLLLAAGAMAYIQYESSVWPQTTGLITVSTTQRNVLSDEGEHVVRYDYVVNNEEHSSSRISFDSNVKLVRVLKAQSDGARNVSRVPQPGDEVPVKYASWWPGLSVLMPGPSPRLWLWNALLILLSVILFAFARLAHHSMY